METGEWFAYMLPFWTKCTNKNAIILGNPYKLRQKTGKEHYTSIWNNQDNYFLDIVHMELDTKAL